MNRSWKQNPHIFLSYAVTALLGVLLFFPSIQWMLLSAGNEEYLSHMLLLGLVLGLLGKKLLSIHWSTPPFQWKPMPCLLLVGSLAGYLASEILWDIDSLSVLFLVFSVFSILGFFLEGRAWVQKFPVFALLACLVPFSYHLETFVGFPLRLYSAKLVQSLFASMGFESLTQDSILIIENKMANVDLPCSGIKSLWVGLLFFLSLSIFENWKIGWRWLMVLATSIACILAANLFRILSLVLVHVWNVPKPLQESLHIPIGLIGFVVSCLWIYLCGKLLLKKSASVTPLSSESAFKLSGMAPLWGILLLACLIRWGWGHSIAPLPTKGASIQSYGNLALTSKEKDLFLRHEVSAYNKSSFLENGISGTMFLIKAHSWRGHHHPEQCLKASGFSLGATTTRYLDPNFPIKYLQVQGTKNQSAAYWFVSENEVTEDFSTRIWRSMKEPKSPWVMVSIYFQGYVDPASENFNDTIHKIHNKATQLIHNKEFL